MTQSSADREQLSTTLNPEDLEQWLAITSVEKLASRVAHDLIQPLGDIVNHAWFCREMIGRNPETEDVHKSLTAIEEHAMQVAEMIRVVRRMACNWDSDHSANQHSNAETIC